MNDQPYSVSRLRTAVVHFIGGRVVQATARAILLLVLVRLLPVEDYGAYMLLVGLSEMMLQVASFGILSVGQRYIPQMISTLSAARMKRFVITLLVLQFVILCVVTLGFQSVWELLATWVGFNEGQVEATRQALWLFLLVPAFRFTAELLEALLEQGKAQVARALMPAGRVVSIGFFLLLGVKVDLGNIILIDVAVTTFCFLLSYVMLRKSLAALNSTSNSGSMPVREMLHFSWHMMGVSILESASSPGAVRLVLANALGIVESGLFAFLQSLQRLVGRYLPGTLLRGIIRPVLISRAYKPGGMKIVEAGTGLLFKSNLMIVGIGSVLVAVVGDVLVDSLSGGRFPQAGVTLLLMFLALAFTAQRSVIEMVMQIAGHTAALRATSIIAPLALLAVWQFADMGLNIAVLIIAVATALSNWIAMTVLVRSSAGFNVDWRGLAAIVVPAVVVVVLGVVMRTTMPVVTLAAGSVVFFILFVWIAKPFNSEELVIVERVAGAKAARLMGLFSCRKEFKVYES